MSCCYCNNQDIEENECGDVHQVNEKHFDNVSRQDCLLVWLSALCCQTNVPLYLANEIVHCDEDEISSPKRTKTTTTTQILQKSQMHL